MLKKNLALWFVPVVIVYITGMFTDIMEIDAAQYASISQEMVQNGSYLQLFDRGLDYLDKPPFLFWVSALSFKLFGISNFTYKLPSVLFSLLGLWATYRLGKLLYNKAAGQYAALVLATCQAWFMINSDIKTDTILAGATAFSLWQLYSYLQERRFRNLLAGAVAIGVAMLTKGPIGIMIPVLAIGTHLLVRRDWKSIFQWQWLLVPVIVLLCLSPMLWGLYQQFDLHPGKMINGVPIQSGLEFYFWTQSFGRITGGNVWKDDTTVLFFTHTFLWAFAPWCLFFLAGWWKKTKELVRSKFHLADGEAFAWGGFVIPFIVLSLSHYKLPHYIFSIFPLAAIITGSYLDEVFTSESSAVPNRWRVIQFVVACLILLLAYLLSGICFPTTPWFFWSILILSAWAAGWFMFRGEGSVQRILVPSLVAMLTFNVLMNANVYPSLFLYTSSNQAARFADATKEGTQSLVEFKQQRAGLDFYAHHSVPNYGSVETLREAGKGKVIWVFADQSGYDELAKAGLNITGIKRLDQYHISKLTALFLNPKTRPQQLQTNYVLKLDFTK